MARPKQPARLVWDGDRNVWAIKDTVAGKPYKRRTRYGAEDRSAAESEFAVYLAERSRLEAEAKAEAPDPEDPTNSNPRLVSIAACLSFYGIRQEGTGNAVLAGQHIGHLLRHWKGMTLAQVRGQACRKYVKDRCAETYSAPGSSKLKHVTASTARRELQTLSAAIGVWHKEYTLTSRPVVTLPPAAEAHPDWLTETEHQRLLKAAQGFAWFSSDIATREPYWMPVNGRGDEEGEHLPRFIEVGYYSGTRSSAILGLGWSRALYHGWVDLPAVTLHRSGPLEPKTRKREPPCRIHDRLLPLFREWREADLAKGVDVVVHDNGRKVLRVSKGFALAAARAGLDRRDIDGTLRVGNPDPKHDIGLPTPHVLRHTRATLMLRAGIPPHEVGEYLGMTVKMVLEVYGHHHVEYQQRAAAA